MVDDHVDRSNLDDASTFYGLTHSPTKAEESETCGSCGTRYLTTDASGHKCQGRFNVRENSELSCGCNPERPHEVNCWNAEENRRLEREAGARGEEMPPRAEDYLNEEAELQRVEREFPDYTAEQRATVARTRIETKQRHALAYVAIENRTKEIMLENPGISFLDANEVARDEVQAIEDPEAKRKHGNDCNCPVCNRVTPSTLQRDGLVIKGGSKNSGKLRRDKKPNKAGTIGVQIEDEPRTVKRDARVTESTDYALEAIEQETGINVAGLLAAIGILRDRGDAQAVFALKTVFRAAPGHEERMGAA